MSVQVVIPTYNERENIPSLISGIFRYLPDARILVVDDNSPDRTGELVDQLSLEYEGKVESLHRKGKRGLGSAYIDGFKRVLGGEASQIIQMDADHSHSPEALPGIIRCAEQFDLALGSRYVSGGGVVDWPFHRILLSRGANFYARFLLGIPVKDFTTGFRCFNRRVLESLDLDSLSCSGYGFQVEMLVRTIAKGFSVGEFPITFRERHRGESKMGFGIAWKAGLDVWRLREFKTFYRRPRLRRGNQPNESH